MAFTHTSEQLQGLHNALHVACGLSSLRMGLADINIWRTALFVLEPLGDMPEGPLAVEDIQDVVGEMKRQNKAGEARWSLRPTRILRDSESLRDMVLLARQKRRARALKPRLEITEQRVGGVTRQVETPVEDAYTEAAAEAREQLRKFREETGF